MQKSLPKIHILPDCRKCDLFVILGDPKKGTICNYKVVYAPQLIERCCKWVPFWGSPGSFSAIFVRFVSTRPSCCVLSTAWSEIVIHEGIKSIWCKTLYQVCESNDKLISVLIYIHSSNSWPTAPHPPNL